VIATRLDQLAAAGVNLTLLQFSPQAEEMERFAEEVIPLVRPRVTESVARA
jgi:FMNH2-dependent dimethyl sulfone monooxygenase